MAPPTFHPTQPTKAPTFGVAVKVCNYTEAQGCQQDGLDTAYCCYTVDAYNPWALPAQAAQEQTRDNLTQEQILDAITWIRDLAVAMFIIDTIMVIIAFCVWAGMLITKDTEKMHYIKLITACATIIDIIFTCFSIGIIVGNNLIDELGNLYNHNCYSDETVEDILGLKEQLSQVLILDGLEAALDFMGLMMLCVGLVCHIEKCGQTADSIHGVLFGLDWILIIVNFFAFVLPAFEAFTAIYNDTSLLCYEGVFITA